MCLWRLIPAINVNTDHRFSKIGLPKPRNVSVVNTCAFTKWRFKRRLIREARFQHVAYYRMKAIQVIHGAILTVLWDIRCQCSSTSMLLFPFKITSLLNKFLLLCPTDFADKCKKIHILSFKKKHDLHTVFVCCAMFCLLTPGFTSSTSVNVHQLAP